MVFEGVQTRRPVSAIGLEPLVDLGQRLGAQAVELTEGTRARETYGETVIHERHRHRYEVNNAYRDRLGKAGVVFSGISPDGHLVEFVELPAEVHPFFVGTQAHPELKSRPTRPHPLFAAFVAAALRYRAEDRLPVELPERERERVAVNGAGT